MTVRNGGGGVLSLARGPGDEGTGGKQRPPHNPQPPALEWDACDIPQAPLAALKHREGRRMVN